MAAKSADQAKHNHERRMKLFKQGLNAKEIAQRCGVGVSAIREWAKVNSIDLHKRRPATITDEQIVKSYKEGVGMYAIAESYAGLSAKAVRKVLVKNNIAITANPFKTRSEKAAPMKPLRTYEDDGQIITVYPHGYARGAKEFYL